MSNFKKFLFLLLGLLVVSGILFGITFFTVKRVPSSDDQSVTLSGQIACLPHKSDGPATTECALGLKDDNNEYYALKQLPNPAIATGSNVIVTGALIPPEADGQYDTVGTIAVTKIDNSH